MNSVFSKYVKSIDNNFDVVEQIYDGRGNLIIEISKDKTIYLFRDNKDRISYWYEKRFSTESFIEYDYFDDTKAYKTIIKTLNNNKNNYNIQVFEPKDKFYFVSKSYNCNKLPITPQDIDVIQQEPILSEGYIKYDINYNIVESVKDNEIESKSIYNDKGQEIESSGNISKTENVYENDKLITSYWYHILSNGEFQLGETINYEYDLKGNLVTEILKDSCSTEFKTFYINIELKEFLKTGNTRIEELCREYMSFYFEDKRYEFVAQNKILQKKEELREKKDASLVYAGGVTADEIYPNDAKRVPYIIAGFGVFILAIIMLFYFG